MKAQLRKRDDYLVSVVDQEATQSESQFTVNQDRIEHHIQPIIDKDGGAFEKSVLWLFDPEKRAENFITH